MINISQLVDNQLPAFFRQEYPLFVEFFKQYYQYTEVDGSSYSLLKKIQSYQDSDFYRDGIILETKLQSDVSATDATITLSEISDSDGVPIYKRFPQEGLLLLESDNGTKLEIVSYKSIDENGVVSSIRRGSAGTTKLGDLLLDSTFYEKTEASDFSASETTVSNISHLFLAAIFKNVKTQYFSGIPIERLNQDISVPTILKYIKDFYTSKGTSPAVEFLFRSAFNDEKILVRYPNEQLIKASVSTWSVDTILQTSLIKFSDGVDVNDLSGLVIKQITYGYDNTIGEASASIEKVIPIKSGNETIYRVFINPESVVGSFIPANQTISRTPFGINNKSLVVDSTVGFPEINGEFYIDGVEDALGNPISFSYAEKTGTEFYDIGTNVTGFTGVQKNRKIYGSNILYVVDDSRSNPRDYYYASFRPTGIVSSIDIENSGLYVKEGDKVEFGDSGKRPGSPLASSWRQNIPGPNNSVSLVNVSGSMISTYLVGDYFVTKGVNQVFENNEAIFVSSNGFPDVIQGIGKINLGPYAQLEPASQRHLKKIPKTPKFGKNKVKLPDNNTIALAVDGVPIVSPSGSETGLNRELVIQGDLQEIKILNSGSGYITAPIVTIDGVGGATAVANISGGKVVSITLTNSGQGYIDTPNVTISSGSGAVLSASFSPNNRIGSIDSLTIDNVGSNYTQTPDIIIVDESGRGRGAKFVVESIDPSSGSIISVRKVAGGYDYDPTKTKVYVKATGVDAEALAVVREWHRDNYREYSQFSDDQNGYPFPGKIPEYHDAYYYVGNPIGIRSTLNDNISPTGIESTANLSHSPIVAWSYDGVPIYGPVGYTNPLDSQSQVKRLESSYFLKSNRGGSGPTTGSYGLGYFIEDYEYKAEGDPLHKDLDEYNGRFCVTPEFPEGRYCYFLTIHASSDLNQNDRQDVKPRYPYVVGPTYKYNPDSFNFTTESILKNLPRDTIRVRDTNNYIPEFGSNVIANVTNVSSGSIDSVIIENPGNNYVVGSTTITPKFSPGDKLFVDDSNTQGVGFAAKVSSIVPKNGNGEVIGISSINYSDISTTLDSRQQKLTINPPTYDVGTSTLSYRKISVGDVITDSTGVSYDLITSINAESNDTTFYFRESNTSNVSVGDTISIGNETLYVNSSFTDSKKYAYLSVPAVKITDPITPKTDQGFYYKFYFGKEIFDELYIDSGEVSTKIGRILEIDEQTNKIKIELYIDNNTDDYYAIPSIGVSISNDTQDTTTGRYTQVVSGVEIVQEVEVIRGYDGSATTKHKANVKAKTQIPSGSVYDYVTRLYITSADMDAFTVGVYIKGAISDASAEIVEIDKISTSTGYLWVRNVRQGADASDLPRFGAFNQISGTFGSETITEIGSGNVSTLTANVNTTQTSIPVSNSDVFPVGRYISIGSETMRIVSKKFKELVVVREQLGTVATSHSQNTTVAVQNASGTFASDEYYVYINLQNQQKFTNTSEFSDSEGETVDITTQEILDIPSDYTSLIMTPNQLNFFDIGDVIRIDNEKMRVESISSNVFEVVRGFENTIATSHQIGDTVTNNSKYIATTTTDKDHIFINGDFVEIYGDPADSQQTTDITVRFDGNANRFLFSSIHTESNFVPNPNLTFIFGHTYIFDISHISNTNTTLSFFSERDYTNEFSVERFGTPGSNGSYITLKVIDESDAILFYNNPNSIITDSNPEIRFIEDPYNVDFSEIFDITNDTFKYLIRSLPEGAARGTKTLGCVSSRLDGEIGRITITNQGFGYESLPEIKGIYFRGDDDFDGDVIIDDDGKILRVDINYGGTRYISPTLYIIGSGSGAVLVPDVSNGTIRQINIIDGGYGYTENTTLVFVEEDPRNVRILPASSSIGKCIGLEIINPGSNFSNNFTMVPETTIPVSMQLIDVSGQYENGETVYQGNVNNPSVVGRVVDYNAINQTIRVNPVTGTFQSGVELVGYLSSTTSTPQTVNTPLVKSNVTATTKISGFFSDDLGKLNTSSQKIQDSYFYQDFSYVIRSQIPVSDWREIIKQSTHPAGFIVFGEVIVDSSASVSTVPIGGSTTCPPRIHSFTFDTRTDVNQDGYIYIRNGQDIQVGDAFRYSQSTDAEVIEWTTQNSLLETITGKLVNDKIYYVLYTVNDPDGKYIALSEYHPDDKFADIDHNREILPLKIIPTDISYKHILSCDNQNPKNQITIEIFKDFIEIEDTRVKVSENGNLKTIIINKSFRMREKRGIGSLISAEGAVAIDIRIVDDITNQIDGDTKIFELRSLGSLFAPFSDQSLIVTLDGVAQEPGKSFTIINDRKLLELQVASSGDGYLEFDSWLTSSTTTDIVVGNPSTTKSIQSDVIQTYTDEDFVYVKCQGIPSYKSTFGPYQSNESEISEQNYIKRIVKQTFAPVTKEETPIGKIGILANGIEIYNPRSSNSYNGANLWNVNLSNSNQISDEFDGKIDIDGTYYHTSNPYALRRQLSDNITTTGDYEEDVSNLSHSPVIGWCYDGAPIYGPYGFSDPLNSSSSIKRIDSGYEQRNISTRNVLPDGTILTGVDVGPPVNSVEFFVANFISFGSSTNTFVNGQTATQVVSDTDDTIVPGINGRVENYDNITRKLLLSSVNGQFTSGMWIKTQTAWVQIDSTPIVYKLGYFIEDHIYTASGDLDEYNGRFCVTPEFPEGRYCYFATIRSDSYNYTNNDPSNNSAYPYFVGPELNHIFYPENQLRSSDLRRNIVFNTPPKKYIDPINGHSQTQKFVGRLFGFADYENNQEYSKKYKNITDQFDNYRTAFNLEYTNQQPLYSPVDSVEIRESGLIFIDGVLQIFGESYTIDDTTNEIIFNEPPKRISKIINISNVEDILLFLDNELILGSNSGAIGKIIARTPIGYEGRGILKVEVLSRDFENNESILGETSNHSSNIRLVGTIDNEDRFLDAANLIEINKVFIANESVERMLLNPANSGFSVPGGSQNCIDDVVDVLGAVIDILRYGGNAPAWDAANLYVNGGAIQHLLGQEDESIEVFNNARDIAIEVIQNQLTSVQGSHGLSQFTDNTIQIDGGVGGYIGSCSNVASTIGSSIGIVTSVISNPSYLSSINRNPGRSFVEKNGIFQEFFGYTNGKYTILDAFDTSSPTTTFLMKRNGDLLVPTSSLQIIVVIDGVIQEYGTSYVINEALLEFYKPVPAYSKLNVLYWYGKDLEKILQGYNLPLYEPNFVSRDSVTGNPQYYVDDSGLTTNKFIRSIKPEEYPLYNYLRITDKVRIDGEQAERSLLDISNRNIIQWENDPTHSNIFYFDAESNINVNFRKVFLDQFTGSVQNSFIIVPGTKVVYSSNGNPDLPGLVDGNEYWLGYKYAENCILFYDNYQNSLASTYVDAIEIGIGTGTHYITVPSDVSGLKQSQIKTSDYNGIVKGRAADFTARVRFDVEVTDTSAYSNGILIFGGGESLASVIEVKSSTVMEVQILPDRIIPDGSTITTDLGGSNPVTVVQKSNGRVVSIQPAGGQSFPVGSDFETAPVLVIRPAATDAGRYARAYASIDQNNQIYQTVVTYGGEEYYQVPDVLVTRDYKLVNETYPLVLTRGNINYWSTAESTLVSTSMIETKDLTVTMFRTVSVADPNIFDNELTITVEPKILDQIDSGNPSVEYDYSTGTYPYVEQTATLPATIISVGDLRLTPTFSILENNKFNYDSTLTIGAFARYRNLTLADVSDRHYSSLFDDSGTTRFDSTPHTTVREFASFLSSDVNTGDDSIPLESLGGFNYMNVQANTFWFKDGDPIYEAKQGIVKGYIERVIDNNHFQLQLIPGQMLKAGDEISNIPNTIKLSIIQTIYGLVEFGNETISYRDINWENKSLEDISQIQHSHLQGDYVKTIRPTRKDI